MRILKRLDKVGKMLYPDVNYECVICIILSKKMYRERKDKEKVS